MLTFFAYVISYQQLAMMAKPTYSESGELEDGGFDLTTDGVCGYVSLMLFLLLFLLGFISNLLWFVDILAPYLYLNQNPFAYL